MAVIRDNMPAFELFQPTSTDEAVGLLDQYGAEAWVLAGGLDTWDWLKDRVKRPSVLVDLGAISGLSEIRSRWTAAWRSGRWRRCATWRGTRWYASSIGLLAEAAAAGGVAADPESGDAGREPEPGHAVLVLPGRVELLPGRGEHLLRGHADGDEPGALHPGGEPVCGGEPVGHGAGADRAGRVDGDPECGRASVWCRRRSSSWAPRWTSSG